MMARRYHRRREAFVTAKIVALACNIEVVFVNVNLITQNVLNISHKLEHRAPSCRHNHEQVTDTDGRQILFTVNDINTN